MIVVSNTSPLTNLAAIGQFDLLKQLYQQIHIPVAVWGELNAFGQSWPGSAEVESATWIEQHQVQSYDLVAILRRDLDQGEAETIALALEIGADLVLLDERDARRAAKRLGLQLTGVVGLLVQAKRKSLLSEIRPQLDALRHQAGFYISDSVYETALDLAQES